MTLARVTVPQSCPSLLSHPILVPSGCGLSTTDPSQGPRDPSFVPSTVDVLSPGPQWCSHWCKESSWHGKLYLSEAQSKVGCLANKPGRPVDFAPSPSRNDPGTFPW